MQPTNNPLNISRRNLIKYGSGFLGASLMASVLGNNLLHPTAAYAQNQTVTPDEALAKLIEGNQRFVNQKRINPNQTGQRLSETAESQAPFAAFLGCADSRVPLEIVFDQGIGDLFVCRVAGNIATNEEIGSLEFGTMVLGAKVLMVLGHERCGAVKATLKGGEFPGQIGSLIDAIQAGVGRADTVPGEDPLERAIKANVIYQAEKLSKSTVIAELINKNQVKIVPAYYDLDTGKVSLLS